MSVHIPDGRASGNGPNGVQMSRRRRAMEAITGRCLSCGQRLTLCGVPFTADIMCAKCLTVNVYESSLKPVRVRQ